MPRSRLSVGVVGCLALGFAATGASAAILGPGLDAFNSAAPRSDLQKVHEGHGGMHQGCYRGPTQIATGITSTAKPASGRSGAGCLMAPHAQRTTNARGSEPLARRRSNGLRAGAVRALNQLDYRLS